MATAIERNTEGTRQAKSRAIRKSGTNRWITAVLITTSILFCFPLWWNVASRGNLTGNHKSTKNPINGSELLSDEEYDYENLSSSISFVGHD